MPSSSTVRKNFFDTEKTDVFQIFRILHLVLFGNMIDQYLCEAVLEVLDENIFFCDCIACFQVDHVIVVGMRTVCTACIVFETYSIAQNVILVVDDFIR